ncbi:hypothetical protein HRbin07_00168 [bacterium HR07]|nr:hypothetical protein HRbin07_00168 [bacterium HR07]
MGSLLHSGAREHGEFPAVLHKRCEVTNDEDILIAFGPQELINLDAAGARAGQRRHCHQVARLDPCGPDQRLRL